MLFFLTFSAFPTIGQMPFVHSISLPQAGDTLFFQTDELPQRIQITPAGTGQLWNFTSLIGPYLETRSSKPALNNLVDIQISFESGIWNSYDIRDNQVLIWKGSAGMTVGKTLIRQPWWSPSGLVMPGSNLIWRDDMDYNAVFNCVLAAKDIPLSWRADIPSGMDSLRISLMIDRNIRVDAEGSMIISGGSRHEVQRLRVEDVINKKLWTKKNGGAWQDITSLVRLDDLLPEQHNSIHFTSIESGGNICTIYLSPSGTPMKVLFVVPREQARFYKNIPGGNYVLAYPNPALSFARFKFLNIPPGTYTIEFYDVFMRSMFQRKLSVKGDETVEINLSQLNRGPYLYSLVDQSGKKLVTRRIFVIKP